MKRYFWIFLPGISSTVMILLLFRGYFSIFAVINRLIVSTSIGVILGLIVMIAGFIKKKKWIQVGLYGVLFSLLPAGLFTVYVYKSLSDAQLLKGSATGCEASEYPDSEEQDLMQQVAESARKKEYQSSADFAQKIIDRFSATAASMQNSLHGYPVSRKKIFTYKPLNLVATALFWQGFAYLQMNRKQEAKAAWEHLIKDFYYGQCWDPSGFMVKPSLEAKELMEKYKI